MVTTVFRTPACPQTFVLKVPPLTHERLTTRLPLARQFDPAFWASLCSRRA